MRSRTLIVLFVILALLATTAALGVAGVVASRNGGFAVFGDLPFRGGDAHQHSGTAFNETFEVSAPLVVDIQIDDGDVRVVGGGARATVVVTATGRAPTAERAAAAQASIQPVIRYSGGVLSVVWHGDANPRPRRHDGRSVEVVVTLPTAVSTTLSIKTRAADIEVRGIRGAIDAATAFGDVRLQALAGSVRASNASGDIVGDGIDAGRENVSVRTEFGDVRLGDVRARAVHAQTTAGDVVLRSVDTSGADGIVATTDFGDVTLTGSLGSPITATSESGDVSVEVDRLAGPITATTDFGDVDVTLPAGTNADASLASQFGSVAAPFPVAKRANRDDGAPVLGRIGRGGPRLTMRSQSGDVRLSVAGERR